MTPAVSVILPVFNSERFLADAINSVLIQDFTDFELLLIYDPSRDSSLEICRSFAAKDKRVRVLENPEGLGLSRSLNLGIEHSRGRYIARMDSDDLSLPERFSEQVRQLDESPEVVALGCDIEIIDERGITVGSRKYFKDDHTMRNRIYFFSPFCHPALMFRKAALKQVGGYDSSYKHAEDYDLYFRLGAIGKFMNINRTLFKYRIVSTSATHSQTRSLELTTIGIRQKYKNAPGFRMNTLAWIYNELHYLSLFVMSPSARTKLFYFLRNRLLARM